MTKFRILDLNVFVKSIFLSSSLRFLYASAQFGKKDYSKIVVLAGKVFVF